MLQAYTLLLTVGIILFSCDLANNRGSVDRNDGSKKGNNGNNGNKDRHVVADLEFSDTSALTKEVGELFSLTVKVSNINLKNIDDSINIGNNPSSDKLRVELDVMKDGKTYGYLHGNESIESGEAKFERLTFDKECAEGCQLVAKIQHYSKEACDMVADCWGECSVCYVDLKPVNGASKDAVFTTSSYSVSAEHVSGKNIKISVTKNGQPLANGKVSVKAYVFCYMSGIGGICFYPENRHGLLSDEDRALDSSGSWSTTLDSDGSWQAASNTGWPSKEPYDLAEKICEVSFSVHVDGRTFNAIELTGGSC